MYPQEQLEELKKYCSKLSTFSEGGVAFLYLHDLHLPQGCTPAVCDALLCPVPRDGYPSQLFFPAEAASLRTPKWNMADAHIAGKNWWAFSWRHSLSSPTLAQILTEHLTAFTRSR